MEYPEEDMPAYTSITTYASSRDDDFMKLHAPERYPPKQECSVCVMESRWLQMETGKSQRKGLRSQVVKCKECGVVAHSGCTLYPRKIHELQQFKGLSCFNIMHTPEGFQIWYRCGSDRKSYSVCRSHPTYTKVRSMY